MPSPITIWKTLRIFKQVTLHFHFAPSSAHIVGHAILKEKGYFRFIFTYTNTVPNTQLMPILKYLLRKIMEVSNQVT